MARLGRAVMLRRPPKLPAPRSLYLLLTAERPRAMLGGVQTVILNQIHAVARNKLDHISRSSSRHVPPVPRLTFTDVFDSTPGLVPPWDLILGAS
jgi:hypothetical protein